MNGHPLESKGSSINGKIGYFSTISNFQNQIHNVPKSTYPSKSPALHYQKNSFNSNQGRQMNSGGSLYQMKGKVIGMYEVIQQIGEGSFGRIYKVRKLSTASSPNLPLDKTTTYVLKEIHIGRDENKFAAQLSEVQVLRNISHQFVVKYIDSFIQEGNLYLTMEFCEKGDLNQYISRFTDQMEISQNIDLPEWRIWKFLIQILLALEHIHEKGVIHADIKPQNILLKGKDYDIRLADFGISQMLSKNYKFVHQHLGTLYYCSPEVCRSQPFNQKTDIWAIGCILYELCMKRKAFDGVSEENLKSKICNFEHPFLQKVSEELQTIYNMCLIKDQERRPDAKDLLRMSSIVEYASKLGIPIGSRQSMVLLNFKVNESSNSQSPVKKGEKQVSNKCSTNNLNSSLQDLNEIPGRGGSISKRSNDSFEPPKNKLNTHALYQRYMDIQDQDEVSQKRDKSQQNSFSIDKDNRRKNLARNVESFYFAKQTSNSEFYKEMLSKVQRNKRSSPERVDQRAALKIIVEKRQPDILIEGTDSFDSRKFYDKSQSKVNLDDSQNRASENKSFDQSQNVKGKLERSQVVKEYSLREPLNTHLHSNNIWNPGDRKKSLQDGTPEEHKGRRRDMKNYSMNQYGNLKEEEMKASLSRETLQNVVNNTTKQFDRDYNNYQKRNNLREFQKDYQQAYQKELRLKAGVNIESNPVLKYQSQTISPFRTSKKPPLSKPLQDGAKKGSMPLTKQQN